MTAEDWSEGGAEMASKPPEAARGKKDSPAGFMGSCLCEYLDFPLLVSRTVRQ